MPPTATYRENATDYKPTLEREDGVYKGVKFFEIADATNIADTHLAVGLPATGDAYDANTPRCLARRFTPDRLPGASGFWRMRVDYAENSGGGGGGIAPANGLRVTTFVEQNRSSVNVNRNIENTRDLTADGTGVPKLVNALTLRVTSFSLTVPQLAPLLELSDSPKLNAAAVVLPRFLDSEQSLDVPKEQLLYAGFVPSREGEFFVVRHELLWRRDWRVERFPTDASGVVDGPPELLNQYATADFAAVLGG